MKDKITKSDSEWKKQLTPEQHRVCRKKGTEAAFTGEYSDCHEEGIYQCVCCGNALFSSETKFDSGTGGQVFQLLWSWKTFEQRATVVCGRNVLRFYVIGVMLILVMFLTMVLLPLTNVIVSILLL